MSVEILQVHKRFVAVAADIVSFPMYGVPVLVAVALSIEQFVAINAFIAVVNLLVAPLLRCILSGAALR
jgi:hypothetical protein